MAKNFRNILTGLALLVLTVSCDRPVCKSPNTVFDRYSPDTKEYKDELAKQLKHVDESKLTYWMDTYQHRDKIQSLRAHIEGEGLCAKIVLSIKDSVKGIEGIIRNKGMGYSGAELKGIKFKINQNSTNTELFSKK